MKKIFLSTLILLLILSSCTSNENEEIVDTPKLPISNEHIDSSGLPEIVNYIYDENNYLKEIINPEKDFKVELIYNNGKVVGVNQSNKVGAIHTKEEYEYIGNNISKYTRIENDILVIDEIYTYNANDVLISVKNIISNTVKDYEYNSTNNSVKIFERDSPLTYSITIYDLKKNIFSNIKGILSILKTQGNKGINNPLEIKEYSNGNLNFSETFTNDYDSDNFLIKVTRNQNYGSFTETYTDKWNYNK